MKVPATNEFDQLVTIPEDYFFAISQKEYSNPMQALVRELLQNSVDAGSSLIMFSFDAESRTLMCLDNGCGMTEDILKNKLLVASKSGKDAGGRDTVGGFGKAKELLFFSWPSWMIKTTCGTVEGSYYRYKFNPDERSTSGTIATITFSENVDLTRFEQIAMRYLETCQIKANLLFNGAAPNPLRRGQETGEIEGLGRIYAEKGDDHSLYVRVKGVTMFSKYLYGATVRVVLELTGDTLELLTANRDGLRHVSQSKFDQWLQDFTRQEEKYTRPKSQVTVIDGTGYADNMMFRGEDKLAEALLKMMEQLPSEVIEQILGEEQHEGVIMNTLYAEARYVATDVADRYSLSTAEVVNNLAQGLVNEEMRETLVQHADASPYERATQWEQTKMVIERQQRKQMKLPDILVHHQGNRVPINLDNVKYLRLYWFWIRAVGKVLSYQGHYGRFKGGFTFVGDYEFLGEHQAYLVNPNSLRYTLKKGMNVAARLQSAMEIVNVAISCVAENLWVRHDRIMASVLEDWDWYAEVMDEACRLEKRDLIG